MQETRNATFIFFLILLSIVVIAIMGSHAAYRSSADSQARCLSNVTLAAQHVARVTEQSTRVVKGIAAWLAANQGVDFSTNGDLLALSPVMNIDPEETHAIAIIEDDGTAWLLDEKYAGTSFDVSKRPYFAFAQALKVNEIGYGPKLQNINTKRDTIAVFYKVIFNNTPIVISTAFSVENIATFFSKAIHSGGASIELLNNGRVDVSSIEDTSLLTGIDRMRSQTLATDTSQQIDLFAFLSASSLVGCIQDIPNTPFKVFATAELYETFSYSTPFIIVIVTLTIVATLITLISHRRIIQLLSDLREEHQELLLTRDELAKTARTAERANQAKSEFLATMSHELRTPLNAILGFSDILSEQYFGPPGEGKYREYAKDIHRSGGYLLELVNDLLDISTIEAGRTSLAKEPIEIRALIADCVRVVDDRAQLKGVGVSTDIMEGTLLPLYADHRSAKQILLNIVTNAVKFTLEGGTVSIRVNQTKQNTHIEITDTGVGIPEDRIPTVTDPFVHSQNSAHITSDGWGLGLSISKSLIDMHDGTLLIASTVGTGTTVTVSFPVEQADENGFAISSGGPTKE